MSLVRMHFWEVVAHGRWTFLLAEEDRFERQHPRDREQHRGVLRHQRSAGHPPMAALLKKGQKRFSDLRTRAGTRCIGSRRSCNSHGGFGLEKRVQQP